MDGVEQLNNILIIGMTNRLDMLDDALLRPGKYTCFEKSKWSVRSLTNE